MWLGYSAELTNKIVINEIFVKPGKRSDRVAERIREILSVAVLNQLKDPRIGFVTITRVGMTDDLRYAKVYFSVLGSDRETKSTKAALEHSKGFFMHLLKEGLPIRTIPEITFVLDLSIKESIALDHIIEKIHKGE